MKFSTRSRYGLRMMVELARLQQEDRLIQLKRIAEITGLSNNYLGQLAISLRNDGLLIGVSGKNGGYRLARPSEDINLREIVRAVHGPIFTTDCVINPQACLNADFCEARTIWALLTHRIQELLENYSLADLIDPNWMEKVRAGNPEARYLHVAQMVTGGADGIPPGCPAELDKRDRQNIEEIS